MKEQGHNNLEIARMIGMSISTVLRYLEKDFNPEHGQYGVSRPGKTYKYREKIHNMREQNKTYKEIFTIIKELGYTGSEAAIRGYVTKEIRLNSTIGKVNNIELVERKWLKKLIYMSSKNVKGISEQQINEINIKYPIFKQLYDFVLDFKRIMFSGKYLELNEWIEQSDKLKISQLNSFVKGLNNDIDAVVNAIRLQYNNGLAEGSVNKIKLVKRIMYGRCKFNTFRSKVLPLEML